MNDRDTFRELRAKLDGSDPFMTGGHGIKKIRRQNRVAPEWTADNKQIREILLRSFPTLATNDTQRRRASVWTRIIHLYYRMGMTYTQVAGEMDIKPTVVWRALKSIQRASKGLRASDGAMRKKDSVPTQTSVGKAQ